MVQMSWQTLGLLFLFMFADSWWGWPDKDKYIFCWVWGQFICVLELLTQISYIILIALLWKIIVVFYLINGHLPKTKFCACHDISIVLWCTKLFNQAEYIKSDWNVIPSDHDPQMGGHFTNKFPLIIENQRKIHIAVIPFLIIWSQQNFAHVMAWAKICTDQFISIYRKLIEMSIKFEIWLRKSSVKWVFVLEWTISHSPMVSISLWGHNSGLLSTLADQLMT